MNNPLEFLWMILQTIFALVVVIGLAFLVFRVILPRVNSFGTLGTNNMVRVVDRVGIETRKSLYVVEVAGKWMLIASSESGMQLIAELDGESAKIAEQEIVKLRQTPMGATAIGKTFSDKLNEVMNRKQGGR